MRARLEPARRWQMAIASLVTVAAAPLPGAAASPVSTPTAVVADIGWSVNPYHRVFRAPGLVEPPAIPGFPADAVALPLTLGDDYGASRAADAAVWDSYRSQTLYWVPGTRLLLFTVRTTGAAPDGSSATEDGTNFDHGTATAGTLARACPSCYVLFIQDSRSLDGEPVRRIVDDMAWVDFAVSTNLPGDPIGDAPRLAQQTRRLHDSGRLYVAGSGNDVVTGIFVGNGVWPLANYNLPPWVVTVGGAYPACRATDLRAGHPAELVGDFLPSIAVARSIDGWGRAAGTSFAAPQVAGGFGEVLARVRRARGDGRAPGALWSGAPTATGVLADGALTAEEIRGVARDAATWWLAHSFLPACVAEDPDLVLRFGAPTPVTVPWIDMGWGYFGSTEAERAAEAILAGEDPVKPVARELVVVGELMLEQVMTARRIAYCCG